VEGQVAYFLRDHLGNPVPSPALFEKIGNRFRAAGSGFRKRTTTSPYSIWRPPIALVGDDRKLDHVKPYLDRAAREGRSGVVAIVAVQELAWVWSGKKLDPKPGQSRFAFVKDPASVHHLLLLRARRRLRTRLHQDHQLLPLSGKSVVERSRMGEAPGRSCRLRFSVLANGFAACDEPRRLQASPTGSVPATSRPSSSTG